VDLNDNGFRGFHMCQDRARRPARPCQRPGRRVRPGNEFGKSARRRGLNGAQAIRCRWFLRSAPMDSDRILKFAVDNGDGRRPAMCVTAHAATGQPDSRRCRPRPRLWNRECRSTFRRAGPGNGLWSRAGPRGPLRGRRSGSRRKGALQVGTLRCHSRMGMPKMDGREARGVLRSAGPASA
jgi:hypothetical protein